MLLLLLLNESRLFCFVLPSGAKCVGVDDAALGLERHFRKVGRRAALQACLESQLLEQRYVSLCISSVWNFSPVLLLRSFIHLLRLFIY
jgi:hypothetical protein